MPGASRRVRRLEKEAILRAKDYEYTREQSDHYITGLNLTYEDEDTERNRRHITTRPIRQIQKDADYPVESLDKITERIQQEIKKRQAAAAATLANSASAPAAPTTSTSTTRTRYTSSSSSTADDRTNRDSGLTGKYTNSKYSTTGKSY